MKKLILALLLITTTSFAGVIDLKDGFNGQSKRHFLKTLKDGKSVVVNFDRPTYVESILLSATGKQRAYSFGKVFADGDEIATLGVPGRDPIYPVIVKGLVSQLTVYATEGSKFKIDSFKIYTGNSGYRSYRPGSFRQSSKFNISVWGEETLAILFELDHLYDISSSDDSEMFKNMKKAAMKLAASERVRQGQSLKTLRKAKELVKIINQAEVILLNNDNLMFSFQADRLLIDLLTVKEDILEEYDFD